MDSVFFNKQYAELLDKNFPEPEADLNFISGRLGNLNQELKYKEVKRLFFELDDLVQQARWHIGILINIAKTFPDKEISKDDPSGGRMVIETMLLLREFVVNNKNVNFEDLNEDRKGGKVYGWIYHMFVDNVIFRVFGVLDRIARILAEIRNVKFSNNKVYFKSGKLEAIHREFNYEETQKLLDMSKEHAFEFLISYRDGYSHSKKEFSVVAGSVPAISYTDEGGKRNHEDGHLWKTQDLLALTNMAYTYTTRAVKELKIIIEKEYR
ncbi:Cthe_2314 family HEPN domain-containing protein [Chryseolinea sp. H1M3-3]|uniref:Cthe_2314 family HEPN domain-containing protein n=1 Tax=Chryseolinea sp. H1M3-3 TaxID=3034144 RepID=UPI0023ECC45B|nr:Cthe_2314 family HEPN domain-containing protein [Chryseolinea sp. H1M3-3]